MLLIPDWASCNWVISSFWFAVLFVVISSFVVPAGVASGIVSVTFASGCGSSVVCSGKVCCVSAAAKVFACTSWISGNWFWTSGVCSVAVFVLFRAASGCSFCWIWVLFSAGIVWSVISVPCAIVSWAVVSAGVSCSAVFAANNCWNSCASGATFALFSFILPVNCDEYCEAKPLSEDENTNTRLADFVCAARASPLSITSLPTDSPSLP